MQPARHLVLVAFALLSSSGTATAAQSKAYVTTTDFSTGGLSVVNLDTRVPSIDVATVHSDTYLRWHDERVHVVNRFGQDNIQVISPSAGHSTVRQYSVGNGSNPQDIVFVSANKAYVSRYEEAAVWIVDSLGTHTGDISLAAFADADGIPEMTFMHRVEDRVFVAVQRLDRNAGFVPTDRSYVVVIDATADTVLDVDAVTPGKQAIQLAGTNPFTDFQFDKSGTRLLIGCAGLFGVLDGGIEAIQPVTLQGLGFVVTEAALGGDVNAIAWRDADRSFALINNTSFSTLVVAWRSTDGALVDTCVSTPGYELAHIALNDRDELYVANNGFSTPGLFVYDAATCTPLAGPISTGLPPFRITFDAASGVVTAAEPWAAGLRLGPAFPNPARSIVRLSLSLDREMAVDVGVFDVSGRRVRALLRGTRPAGPMTLVWDLRDENGRRLEAGVYWVRAATGRARFTRPVVTLP